MAIPKPYKTGEAGSDSNPRPTKQMHASLWRADDGTLVETSNTDPMPVTGGSSGGGGGPATIADGADVAQGTIGDTQADGTVLGFLSSLYTKFFGTPVAIKVDGSGVTQPISAAALPLPAGAATSAAQTTAQTSLSSIVTSVAGAALESGGNLAAILAKLNAVVLAAGSAIIGKVSIDQTTPGTTNAVAATNLPTSVDTNSGNKSSSTLRVVLATDQPQTTTALKVDGSAVTQPVSVAATLPVDGATASGSAVANPPVTVGGRAATTNPTAVADGQVVNTMHTKHGKLVAVNIPRELKSSQKTTISNSTAETTIVTDGGAGVFNDVYGLTLANTGATTTKVDIRDATGGAIIDTIEVPAGETRGFHGPADSGYSQTTAHNNWTAQCAAATTAMEVTARFVKTT